jgi:hypothetical protein
VIGVSILKHLFNGLASVGFAIQLLVLIAAASILGGVIPQGENVALIASAPGWVREFNVYLQLNDIFHAWWYVSLLVLLCISLLAVTIKRVPTVWRQRGGGVATGILLAHAGILLIIGGAIYGGFSGFRYYVRVVEGEVAILPALPFVIKLDRFTLEYYPREAYGDAGMGRRIPRRQESELTLFRSGTVFQQAMTAPGHPVTVEGITLLADDDDIGWAFTLVVVDPVGREKVIPALPWAPPLVRLGMSKQRIFAHGVTRIGVEQGDEEKVVEPNATEVFLLKEDGSQESLGFASEAAPVTVYKHTVFPWNIRPYTGLNIYRRSGTALLIAGLTCLLAGLLINLYAGRRPLASTQARTGQ